jgi:hypothetical protein
MREYWGLIEALMTLGGVSLFVWWQMRTLNRDVAAREKREAEARAKASADAETVAEARQAQSLSAGAKPGAAS